MISVSPFANAVCYIDKTINKAVSTIPNETFNITAVTDTHEYEFVDASNEQVKLSSLDQLEILYADNTGKFSKTIPTAALELSISDTGTLKISVNDQTKADSWAIALIKFGDAIVDAENHIAP